MEREWDHFENCLDARCKQLWHHHLPETFESKQIGYSTSLTWFFFKECFLNNLEVQEPSRYVQSTRIPTIDNQEVESHPYAENHPREKENNFKSGMSKLRLVMLPIALLGN